MIPDGYKTNFETLQRAHKEGNICLLECKDAKTHRPVMVICAVNWNEDDGGELVPLAKMFDGNPYDEIIPPKL